MLENSRDGCKWVGFYWGRPRSILGETSGVVLGARSAGNSVHKSAGNPVSLLFLWSITHPGSLLSQRVWYKIGLLCFSFSQYLVSLQQTAAHSNRNLHFIKATAQCISLVLLAFSHDSFDSWSRVYPTYWTSLIYYDECRLIKAPRRIVPRPVRGKWLAAMDIALLTPQQEIKWEMFAACRNVTSSYIRNV